MRLLLTFYPRRTAVETLSRRIYCWRKFSTLWTSRSADLEAGSLSQRLQTINEELAGKCKFPPAIQLAILKTVCNVVNTTARYQHVAGRCPFFCGVQDGDTIRHFAVCRAVAKANTIILPGLMPAALCDQPLRCFLCLDDSANGNKLAGHGLILDAVIAAHAAARRGFIHNFNEAVTFMRARSHALARSQKVHQRPYEVAERSDTPS